MILCPEGWVKLNLECQTEISWGCVLRSIVSELLLLKTIRYCVSVETLKKISLFTTTRLAWVFNNAPQRVCSAFHSVLNITTKAGA